MGVSKRGRRRAIPLVAGLMFTVLVAPIGQPTASAAPPTFAKSFAPSTIGTNATATLTFTISNPEVTAAIDLAFTDNMPAAITVAAPANIVNNCNGTVTADASAISLTGGRVAPLTTCTISVDTTASTPAVHTNTTGDLTSSNGNSGTASADLTVAIDRPGFSKAFSPSTVDLGERSTLTFDIDNTLNASAVPNLDFTDTLPTGMTVASPSGAITDCGTAAVPPLVTATSGSNVITLDANGTIGFPAVAAGGSCSVSVDVVAGSAGEAGNTSGELLVDFTLSSGKASAVLTTNVSALHLTKEFTDDAVAPGGTATLEFDIRNFARSDSASGVTFSDDLDAALSGLVAVAPLPTDPCGAGSTLTGTSTLTLAGGSVGPGGSCTFSVTVQVPAGPGGAYVNTTSAVSGTVGGSPVTGNDASDTLFIVAAPTLTKEFTDDPVGPGDTVTLHFELTDTSTSGGSTDIAFTDELTTFLPFPVSLTLPAAGFCGAGSTATIESPGTDRQSLFVSGASLASGDSCGFDVAIDIPSGFPGNLYTNTTDPLTATVNGASVTGGVASDDLIVIASPYLRKEFIDDPVAPGDTTTLQFTIENGAVGDDTNTSALGQATDISFTDDLTFASGITAVGLPLSDVCGTGSSVTGAAGDTFLTFVGGTLDPLESCTFSVTLQTSASTPQGSFTNTTSTLDATAFGTAVTSPPVADTLIVADVGLTKEFTDDPVQSGGTVTLEFTIDNSSPTEDATGISFTDDLDADLSGLSAAVGELPLSGCGGTLSGAAGGTFLTFSGGSVPAGTSCSFSVVLDVPAATPDTYSNTTSAVSATIGGTAVVLPPALDDLVIAEPPELLLQKEFTNSPVDVGGTATLQFTVSNPSTVAVTTIGFTDDLSLMGITGLTATGLPNVDPCGTGSMLTGSIGDTVLTLSNGSLAAGTSCTFSVDLPVPTGANEGVYTNTTGTIAGTSGGLAVTGPAATADLTVEPPQDSRADLSITKTDNVDPVVAGGELVYTITVSNAGPSLAQDVVVTDVLPTIEVGGASITQVTFGSTTGCSEDPNGVPSCSLGDIAVGEDASYTVTVTVNPDTIGTITNTATVRAATTDSDLANNTTTEDTVVVSDADLSITKTDSTDPVSAGDPLTYTVTVSNAGPSPAVDVVVTDTLPAGVTLDSTTGCAEDPNGVATCSLGTIAAGSSASYTITVDVDSSTTGTINNIASVTALNPDPDPSNNTTSEDTEVVADADLSITKTDSADPVTAGNALTYTITVDNAGPSDATGVTVTDTLPAGVTLDSTTGCTEDPGGAPTCTLGDIAAGASASYTVTVDVDINTVGTITNTATVTATTTDPDPSNNTTSEDTEVDAAPIEADLAITKVDDVDPIRAHSSERLTYTITVTNLGPFDAEDVVVTDVLPSGIQFNDADGCQEHKKFGVPTCTLGDIAAGESASYTIEVKMKTQTPLGIMTNSATVSSSTDDPDPSNNTATEDTLVCSQVVNGQCAGNGNLISLTAGSPAQTDAGGAVVPTGGLPATGSSGVLVLLTLAIGAMALGVTLFGTSRRRRSA